MQFKACPRSEGDLVLVTDHYGDYRNCVQCGYEKDLPNEGGKPLSPTKPLPVIIDSNRSGTLLDLESLERLYA